MSAFSSLFKRKSRDASPVEPRAGKRTDDSPVTSRTIVAARVISALDAKPYHNQKSYIDLFKSLPEVFFPIDFIARRIASAHFEIKRYEDDSTVWCTGRGYKTRTIAMLLSKPNCLQTWREFVYMHFVYKLATGNGFIRSAMSSDINVDSVWRWCSNLWTIPSDLITVKLKNYYRTPLYGVEGAEDIVESYQLEAGSHGKIIIPTNQMWHDRDVLPDMVPSDNLMRSCSRLDSVMPAIETLEAVYKARNTIYTKGGAIGVLTNKTKDEAGHVALTPEQKKELREEYTKTYGLQDGQSAVLITDSDLAYFRIAMTIQELQPFDETLLDAITIAGAYGVPDVLVPRKDHSTFSNQATAEKSVYTGVIIPMAEQFCQELTEFLGTERDGYYIACNFRDVDCLQVGLKEAEEVKKLVNERCKMQFDNGLISINDWRGQIHESALVGDVFGKCKFEMSPEEIEFINAIINNTNTKPQQENDDERKEEESDLTDENTER